MDYRVGGLLFLLGNQLRSFPRPLLAGSGGEKRELGKKSHEDPIAAPALAVSSNFLATLLSNFSQEVWKLRS